MMSQRGGDCAANCNDFTSQPAAGVAYCAACAGPNIADCTAGTCAEGYHTFVNGDALSTKCSGALCCFCVQYLLG
jgi:hypothetical protein